MTNSIYGTSCVNGSYLNSDACIPNVKLRNGARVARYSNGQPFTGTTNRYFIDAVQPGVMAIGDFVVMQNPTDQFGTPGIRKATPLDKSLLGVVVGFEVDYNAGTMNYNNYRVSGECRYALVADDANLVFEMAEDSPDNNSALFSDDIGGSFSFSDDERHVFAGTSTTSRMAIDHTSKGSGPLRLQRVITRPDNHLGSFARWEVKIHKHQTECCDDTTDTAATVPVLGACVPAAPTLPDTVEFDCKHRVRVQSFINNAEVNVALGKVQALVTVVTSAPLAVGDTFTIADSLVPGQGTVASIVPQGTNFTVAGTVATVVTESDSFAYLLTRTGVVVPAAPVSLIYKAVVAGLSGPCITTVDYFTDIASVKGAV